MSDPTPIPVLAELALARQIAERIGRLQRDLIANLDSIERALAGGLPARLRQRPKPTSPSTDPEASNKGGCRVPGGRLASAHVDATHRSLSRRVSRKSGGPAQNPKPPETARTEAKIRRRPSGKPQKAKP